MVFAGKNLPSTILFKNFDGTGVLILPSENKIQKIPTPKIPTPKIGFSQSLCGFRQFANCRYSEPAIVTAVNKTDQSQGEGQLFYRHNSVPSIRYERNCQSGTGRAVCLSQAKRAPRHKSVCQSDTSQIVNPFQVKGTIEEGGEVNG